MANFLGKSIRYSLSIIILAVGFWASSWAYRYVTSFTSVHWAANPFRGPWLFICMIIGIIFSQIYNEASLALSNGEKVSARMFIDVITINPLMWMALTVSPFVYYTTYIAVRSVPDNFVASFFAFQNGFFWQTVFALFKKRVNNESGKLGNKLKSPRKKRAVNK